MTQIHLCMPTHFPQNAAIAAVEQILATAAQGAVQISDDSLTNANRQSHFCQLSPDSNRSNDNNTTPGRSSLIR